MDDVGKYKALKNEFFSCAMDFIEEYYADHSDPNAVLKYIGRMQEVKLEMDRVRDAVLADCDIEASTVSGESDG